MNGLLVLYKRELKKWVGRKPVLVMSLLTPLIWIALFGKSFNISALFSPEVSGVPPQLQGFIKSLVMAQIKKLFGTTDYFTFFASGMLVAFSIFQGAFSGIGVVFDKRLGYMRRILVTPVPRASVYLAKLFGTLTRISILSLVLLAASLPLGFQFKEGLTLVDVVMPWIIILLLSTVISSVYMALAFSTDNHEVLFAASNLLNLPLMFGSSALFPVKQMPEWLQVIAKYNPVTHAADLVRYHLIGTPIENYGYSLGYLVMAAVVTLLPSIYYSVRRMEKGV